MSHIDLTQNFFGRKNILELLRRRVIDLKEGYRQNLALLGNQYVGKSSVLQYFISNLDEPDVTTIYLDLEGRDFGYFFPRFIGSLLYDYSKKRKLPLYDDLNLLMESTKELIPNTIQVIQKVCSEFEKGKFAECYLGLLTIPEIFTNETGQFCVLIFDEFQNLEDFSIPDVFQSLGKKIMTQKRCFYLMASSNPSIAQKILSEKLSLLFGNFEVLQIDSFDLDASQNFIDTTLADVKIGVQLRNFLTDFAGGHPLYLNLICRELLNLAAIHKQNEIYMPLMAQAVENTIFDRWGVISRHFELITNDLCSTKGNRISCPILMEISNGRHKVDELVKVLSIKKTQVNQKLNRLQEMGILVKNGNFYYFKDKLFKYWIKFVYQKRLKDIELAPDKQRKQFKDEFNHSVEEFKLSSRQEFSSRIIELLHCFDNESFNLNGRKYKLPFFREITSSKLRSDSGKQCDMIKASTDDAVWYVVAKKDNLGESDINAVLDESKKIGKPERCIIVSLSDIEDTARLKALQERYWIWNEGELNTLLTLFNKPYIL